MSIDHDLVPLLASYRGDGVFNQYQEEHPEHDLPDAAEMRINNLRRYLDTFRGARHILLAEAAGYQGCRFSGVPMTSEAQLVEPAALHWARGQGYTRTSRRGRLWREPSATILWETLGDRMDCLVWNTFPWHPYGRRGPLSNRTPRKGEVAAGNEVLLHFLALFPEARPVAVGRVAERTLGRLGMKPGYIRHPSHGGKPQFAAGIESLLFK